MDVPPTNDVWRLTDSAILCDDCYRSLRERDSIPSCSIIYKPLCLNARQSLPKLSVFEATAIQRNRLYRHVLKLKDGSASLAVSGHVVAVEAPPTSYKTEQILPAIDGDSISVFFIGKQERFNSLIQVREDGTVALVQAYSQIFRCDLWRIMQWLKFLKENNSEYSDVTIKEDLSFLLVARDKILDSAHVTTDEMVATLQDHLSLNHPSAPTDTDPLPANQLGTDVFRPLSYSVVETQDAAGEDSCEHAVLSHVAKTLEKLQSLSETDSNSTHSMADLSPTHSDSSATRSDKSSSHYEASSNHSSAPSSTRSSVLSGLQLTPEVVAQCEEEARAAPNAIPINHTGNTLINEYTSSPKLLSTCFPTLFPCGAPYEKQLTISEIKHLVDQACNVYTDSHDFIFYLFNSRGRFAANKGVMTVFRKDASKIAKVSELLNEPNFVQRVQEAAANPRSLSAQDILKKLLPILQVTL